MLLGEQGLQGAVLGRVVGHVIAPAAPDDRHLGSGHDAYGVWVLAATGDCVVVQLGGPGTAHQPTPTNAHRIGQHERIGVIVFYRPNHSATAGSSTVRVGSRTPPVYRQQRVNNRAVGAFDAHLDDVGGEQSAHQARAGRSRCIRYWIP